MNRYYKYRIHFLYVRPTCDFLDDHAGLGRGAAQGIRNTWKPPEVSHKPAHNTDGIFNRFVTVFANRARHLRGELSLGRESEAI